MKCLRIIILCYLLLLSQILSASGISSPDQKVPPLNQFLKIYKVSDNVIRIIISESSSDAKFLNHDNSFEEYNENIILYDSHGLYEDELLSNTLFDIRVMDEGKTISFFRKNGDKIQSFKFNDDLTGIEFDCGKKVLTGLGGGNKGIDRRGNYYPMVPGQIKNDYVFFGASVPIPFLMSLENWAILINRPFNSEFDLRMDVGNILLPENKELDLSLVDLYFFIAENPKEIIKEVSALTGRAELPPKWALGYMQSHRTLSDSKEVLRIANTFREKELPCDALIYLGTGFCPAGWNLDHGSLNFNPEIFEKPKEIVSALKEENFKVILHVNRPPANLYGSFSDTNIGKNDSSHIKNYWGMHSYLTDMGIDGFWPDEGDKLNAESKLARHRLYFEGPLSQKPNQRPFSLHRTGYVGMQKYGGWIWSGDIWSTWESLKEQVSAGINFSVGGSPFWGSDIGGFNATPELTGELYARWFEFGCFSPSFRAHGRSWHLRLPWGWNTGDPGIIEMENFIDGRGNPDVSEFLNDLIEPICKKYLELRYQLLPYNYSLCWEAHQSGLPLMRPLWLEFPEDLKCHQISDQYLWGQFFMIAPVTESKIFSRNVYLPFGGWYDFWTNRYYPGNQEITAFSGIGYLPIFIKAGAIIPFDPIRQYTSEIVEEPTKILIYTGANGDFQYYNDDGISYNYKKDNFDLIHFMWNNEKRILEVQTENLSYSKNENQDAFLIQLIPEMETKEIMLREGIQMYEF